MTSFFHGVPLATSISKDIKVLESLHVFALGFSASSLEKNVLTQDL